MKKLSLLLVGVLTAVLFLVGCGNDTKKESAAKTDAKGPITIGVTAGPHAEVMDFVKQEAAKQGVELKVVEFSDFVQPNVALDNKELDMNSFQHQPYLDNMVKDRGMKLVTIGKSILLPMGLYSSQVKDLKDLPEGASIAIPNDPTNGGRALLLLQQAGIVKLKEGLGVKATVADIIANPKNVKIQELDAAQIPHSIKDVTLAAVNTNYALQAKLNPLKDALVIENKDSLYANVIVVREADKDNARYKKVVEIYNSPAVKKFVEEHFKGTIVPAF